MMNEEERSLLSSELMVMGNVVSEVLWVIRHQQKNTAGFSDTQSVKIFLSKSEQEHSKSSYTLKEYVPHAVAQDVTVENFLKGPIEQLKKLLSKTQGRSECTLRIGPNQYNLLLREETITSNLVQQATSSASEGHSSFLEFYLKILISKSFERADNEMNKKVEQNLQRYKMANPEIVISFQSALSNFERLMTCLFDETENTIKIGGLTISLEPGIYVSEAQRSKFTNIHIGHPIKLSGTSCDPTFLPVSYCQIGCAAIDCSTTGGGGGAGQVDRNGNIIKVFIHGPDGMPLFEGREIPFMGDFKKMLEGSIDMKIEEYVPIQRNHAEGCARPDLMFRGTNCQFQPSATRCRKQERQPTLNLILHLVLSLEDQQKPSTLPVVDCLEMLRQNFTEYCQGNESGLKNEIKESFLELFGKRSEKCSKQRQKEEALERAIPTVVESITTILSHSTNENFRKNCLAYAGATDTMELANFLTDNLTSITNRSLYPIQVEHLDHSAEPSELVAEMTDKTSLSLLSDHQFDESSTEELEELNDLDLFQAFSQATDNESCGGEFDKDIVGDPVQGAESDHWTDLSQTTDEIVKSLLEDSLDEDFLSADWLVTEE